MGKIQLVPNAEKASDSHTVTKSQFQSPAVVPNLSPQVSPTGHVLGNSLRTNSYHEYQAIDFDLKFLHKVKEILKM